VDNLREQTGSPDALKAAVKDARAHGDRKTPLVKLLRSQTEKLLRLITSLEKDRVRSPTVYYDTPRPPWPPQFTTR
jgi:hypothetical protein